MKTLEHLTSSIEEAERLDRLGDGLAVVDRTIEKQPLLSGFLKGEPIGHPMHPLLVTLPIGAWVSASVLDAFRNEDAARHLVGLGVITAAPTVAAGLTDWGQTSGTTRRVGIAHSLINAAALASYTTSWALRRRGRNTAGVLTALAGAGLMSAGGYLGGHMTYRLGAGVEEEPEAPSPA